MPLLEREQRLRCLPPRSATSKAANRYDIPAFYELHAWVWKHNPSGVFEGWNPSVHCPGEKHH